MGGGGGVGDGVGVGVVGRRAGRIQGGGALSESLGIDFYSGYRKKIQVYTTFIVASGEKNTRGGVQFEILKKSRYRLL